LQEIRKQTGALIKTYQAEIDSLTKRAKAAEAAFISVYTPLSDVPDPVPLLQNARPQPW
jgi:homeobox protein cut-like